LHAILSQAGEFAAKLSCFSPCRRDVQGLKRSAPVDVSTTIHGLQRRHSHGSRLGRYFSQAAGNLVIARPTQEWTCRPEIDMPETLAPNIWLERCARRISEVDNDIAEAEARRVARDLQRFERTAAMPPEAAVDFVAMEMAKPNRSPFERRRTDRG
jgi:hypothetical protein